MVYPFQQFLKDSLYFLKTLILFIFIFTFIKVFLFTNYGVNGNSMLPTFYENDRVIVSKIAYKLGNPERFDIIVFHANNEQDFIKRIIGLPGDKIEYKNNILYVNNRPIPEHFLSNNKEKKVFTEDFSIHNDLGYEQVPDGHLFVIGDNRGNSVDSRHLGFIPIEDVVGKVIFTYYPIENINWNYKK